KNETVSNVVVKDIIPEGTSFKSNSSNYPAVKQGNKLYFDLGNMNFSEEEIITYSLQTSPGTWSQQKFKDEVPDDQNVFWISQTLGSSAPNPWMLTDSIPANTGNFAWMSQEATDKSQQALVLNPDVYAFHVDGNLPTLRFYHRYQTQAGISAGVVEVREVGTTRWQSVSQNIIRNKYPGVVDYRTFVAANVEAYSGNSGNEFKPTYVDLSPWKGKDIQIRFRFGTFTNTHHGLGWLIDDIEFMDLISYNEEACVTTDQGDFACDTAPENGTIVDSKEEQVSTDPPLSQLNSRIYPNPATDLVTVALTSDQVIKANISLLSIEGKLLFAETFDVIGSDYLHINTSTLPAGVYLVKVNSGQSHYTERVIVQKP
ncbi:MAG TPA: T9SS type A sorting domain-containing protein, partial [Saprospiraceae bacterium]